MTTKAALASPGGGFALRRAGRDAEAGAAVGRGAGLVEEAVEGRRVAAEQGGGQGVFVIRQEALRTDGNVAGVGQSRTG